MLKLLPQMIQSMYVIIVIKMRIQASYVPLRRMLTLVSNKNRFQRFQRLTFKDPKLCGYQKLKFEFYNVEQQSKGASKATSRPFFSNQGSASSSDMKKFMKGISSNVSKSDSKKDYITEPVRTPTLRGNVSSVKDMGT